MPSDWTNGYVTEIDYTFGFYRELAPIHLAFATNLRGLHAPDVNRPFTYFELGCGQGMSTTVFAASYPHAQFFANDFNPAHIQHARTMADAAGLTNLTFLERSFADLAREDLPDFDFITLHGIYSWIDADARAHIQAFIRQRLKPGGIVYISYNTHPGCTPMVPIRRLMTEYAKGLSGPITERVRAAFAFAARLKDLKPAYFEAAPAAIARVEKAQQGDPRYLAHEYFNAAWEIFHFADLAADMHAAKLGFVGSANIIEAFEPYVVGASRVAFLNEQSDPIVREMLKDLVVNQTFRKDIFVRGVSHLRPLQRTAALHQTRIALMVPADKVSFKHTVTGGELTMSEPSYRPIIEQLTTGAKTIGEIAAALRAETGPANAELLANITTLAAFNQVMPVPSVPAPAAAAALNAILFERCQAGEPINALASPVWGAVHVMNQLDQVLLRAAEGRGQAAPDEVLKLLQKYGFQYNISGRVTTDGAEILGSLENVAKQFNAERLGFLRLIGIATKPN